MSLRTSSCLTKDEQKAKVRFQEDGLVKCVILSHGMFTVIA